MRLPVEHLPCHIENDLVVPSFLEFTPAGYIAATHLNFTLLGPTTLYPGASTPANPGETVIIYAVGFGNPSTTLTVPTPAPLPPARRPCSR